MIKCINLNKLKFGKDVCVCVWMHKCVCVCVCVWVCVENLTTALLQPPEFEFLLWAKRVKSFLESKLFDQNYSINIIRSKLFNQNYSIKIIRSNCFTKLFYQSYSIKLISIKLFSINISRSKCVRQKSLYRLLELFLLHIVGHKIWKNNISFLFYFQKQFFCFFTRFGDLYGFSHWIGFNIRPSKNDSN